MMFKSNVIHTLAASALAVTLSLSMVPMTSQAATKPLKAGASITREVVQANQSLQTGRYEAAESQYTAILKKEPGNLKARSGLAFAQAELYKLDAAEKNAKEVLAKDPKNAIAYGALGAVYRNRTASLDMTYKARREELLTESTHYLQKGLSFSPKSAELYNQLGETYLLQSRYNEAQKAFDTALKYDPTFAEALVNQGVTQYYQGNVFEAIADYQDAIRINSKNYHAHYRLGEAYLTQGDTHQALKSLNTALSLAPNNASVLAKVAEANHSQGNTAAAVANFQKAQLSNPAYMPAYVGQANIYDHRGDEELAMSTLRSALNVNPNFNQARNQLGYLALRAGKPEQALQYFNEALKNDPNDPSTLEGLSQALLSVAEKSANDSYWTGDNSALTDAELSIEKAIEANPNDLRLRLAQLRLSHLSGKPEETESQLTSIISAPARTDAEKMIQGQAHFALGHYQESDTIFRSLIQSNRTDTKQLLLIGDTLTAEGDLQVAREAYMAVGTGNVKAQRAIDRINAVEAESKKDLRLAHALNRKGLASLFNKNQKESAVDYYEETLSKNPRQPQARLELAKLYERFKDYDKAAQSYQMYMGLEPNMSSSDQQFFEHKVQKMHQMAQSQPND